MNGTRIRFHLWRLAAVEMACVGDFVHGSVARSNMNSARAGDLPSALAPRTHIEAIITSPFSTGAAFWMVSWVALVSRAAVPIVTRKARVNGWP